MNPKPGHVPIITRSTEQLDNRYRLQFWRIRTALCDGNAPDPFQPSSLPGWIRRQPHRPRVAARHHRLTDCIGGRVAARPDRPSLTGQGTYSTEVHEFTQAEARLILRFMTGLAAACLAAFMICLATMPGAV